MTKQSGLGANLYAGGYDLSNDTRSVDTISSPRETFDMTGIDKSAMERLHSKRDGTIEFTVFFNDAAGKAHVALSSLPTTDRTFTYAHRATLGAPAASLVAKQIDYAPSREDDGMLTEKVSALANGFGLEWGALLTAGKRTDTTATNGTSVDFTASSAFGFQAYLQVFAFTGTSVTVKIQESSDNGAGDAFADVTGGSFVAATAAPATQRIATATGLSVERYLRVVTTGTFSSAQFAVMVVRNSAVPVF